MECRLNNAIPAVLGKILTSTIFFSCWCFYQIEGCVRLYFYASKSFKNKKNWKSGALKIRAIRYGTTGTHLISHSTRWTDRYLINYWKINAGAVVLSFCLFAIYKTIWLKPISVNFEVFVARRGSF